MKRLLLSVFAGAMLANWASASPDSFYLNTGNINRTAPPDNAPQIDAFNFINTGVFIITNLFQYSLVSPPLPFQTWDTLNWTNRNLIAGDPGFRFDFFDSASSLDRMSASFVNANTVNETNAWVFGVSYVQISATNVVNRGTLGISGAGLLRIDGDNIDLKRGRLAGFGNQATEDGNTGFFGGFFFFFFFGFERFLDRGFNERYWGANIDFFRWQDNFQPTNFHTPPTIAETITNNLYFPYVQELFLTNGFTYYQQTSPDSPFHANINQLFLSQLDA